MNVNEYVGKDQPAVGFNETNMARPVMVNNLDTSYIRSMEGELPG